MTDQTESASEYAELLADLDFYDEDHWRNVMRQYPGAQDAIRKAAAAIRALEAKVRGMDEAVEWLERDRDLWHQRAKINEDRADKYAAQSAYLLPALSEARLRIEADRDRLAGEVERQVALCEQHRAAGIKASAEVARLTSELAAARENEARYLWLCEPWTTKAELDAAIDVARRAGGEG